MAMHWKQYYITWRELFDHRYQYTELAVSWLWENIRRNRTGRSFRQKKLPTKSIIYHLCCLLLCKFWLESCENLTSYILKMSKAIQSALSFIIFSQSSFKHHIVRKTTPSLSSTKCWSWAEETTLSHSCFSYLEGLGKGGKAVWLV